MRYLSVFSGIEAASVAWEPLGWKPVGFSEIEPFPCAVLKHRFPNTPNYGDITQHTQWPISAGDVDLLIGGSPCQAFSVGGFRQGLADPRGDLALVYLGLAERLKPRWIVWENVFGVLSSNGGRDLGTFLWALGQLGYGWAFRVLDTQHFRGTPQRRRRIWLVAYRNPVTGAGDWRRSAAVLFESKSLLWDKEQKRKKGSETSPGVQESVRQHDRLVAFRKSKRAQSDTDYETWLDDGIANTINLFDVGESRTTHAVVYDNHAQDSRIEGPFDVAPTVHAKYGTGGNNVPLTLSSNFVRQLTNVEVERLQGFPDNWTRISWNGKPEEECPDSLRYKACGNSFSVPVARWIGERIDSLERTVV